MKLISHKKLVPKIIFWGCITALIIVLAKYLNSNIQGTIYLIVSAILAYTVIRKPLYGIYIAIILPIFGELIRLPYGPDNGLLFTDIFLATFTGLWLLRFVTQKKRFIETKLNKPLYAFVVIAALSLVQSTIFLNIHDVALGSLYLLRLISIILLFFITIEEISKQKNPQAATQKILNFIVFSGVAIAICGFIQLIIYPDLNNLQEYGWDPHLNRLVSTWLDPNFIGGYLSFIISLLLSFIIFQKEHRARNIFFTIICAVALFLTYSRSGYLALLTSLLIIGLFKSRKTLIIFALIFIFTISISDRAYQRTQDLIDSAKSIIFDTNQNPDPTAKLRIQSWQDTISLIAQKPILGTGFNTLKYVKFDEGLVQNIDVHSASGSDSTFLTILATTGIIGFIPYLLMQLSIVKSSFLVFKKQHDKNLKAIGLGTFAGYSGLLVHSFFVNSLLFVQILIPVYVVLGIIYWRRNSIE